MRRRYYRLTLGSKMKWVWKRNFLVHYLSTAMKTHHSDLSGLALLCKQFRSDNGRLGRWPYQGQLGQSHRNLNLLKEVRFETLSKPQLR